MSGSNWRRPINNSRNEARRERGTVKAGREKRNEGTANGERGTRKREKGEVVKILVKQRSNGNGMA
jgi:hypothetical protein